MPNIEPGPQGLYDPQYEHDACGVGFIADLKNRKSHQIVQDALQILLNLEHRGACGCEANTGDGAGILIQMPHDFFYQEAAKIGVHLPEPGSYGTGLIFLPQEFPDRSRCEKIMEKVVRDEGQQLLGWRDLPTDNSLLGPTARKSEPVIRQILIGKAPGSQTAHYSDPLAFERKLYIIRKLAEILVKH